MSTTCTQVAASVLHGAKDLRQETRDLPTPADDEVQIAVQSTGLCGSDLHYFNHYRNGDIIVREPLTLGHESAGTVVATGASVTDLAVGDRVALEVGLSCEQCEYCCTGRYNICKGMKFRSSAKANPHAQGTLQEKINHPARWCHKLPPALSLDLGALMEPLSVAMHARNRAALDPSTTLLVLGAGAVGLLVAAVSRAAGHEKIVIADINEDRLDFAVNNGFADVSVVVPMARPETVEDKLKYAKEVAGLVGDAEIRGEKVGEVGAVYECTGVETCLQASIYATKPGGRIMIIGMGTPVLTLPISAAALREVDLVGVFRYANTYKEVIAMLSNPPKAMPDLTKMVTQRFKGMEKISEAFAMAGKVKDDEGNLVLKVVVDMS
ncbi:Sorbitol dehydrogenase-like protein [Emericellopsis cladophorae]|uniref:Sorbitol dehydrogenase-like protein n=1 Tax=Emericellopsis cladophorae TaxID=2686198 RepID=A0A9Q0BCL7_9HYPO|nr:Sorbitol dehydrogenase-like protein [Emericellopsis cladophorae]KAI6780472.1 Sorbitol dehydrogenase-like protein [Emericellopsis cladophorae]